MLVTINTDASFNQQKKRGTFAFWIVCDDYRIKQSGVLRDRVTRPEIAETRCIINALHTLLNYAQYGRKITKIIINTDCLNAVHVLTNNRAMMRKYSLNSWGIHLYHTFDRLRFKHKIAKVPIEFRHVRAHTGVDDKRSFVNEWCDQQAKAEMKKLLQVPAIK